MAQLSGMLLLGGLGILASPLLAWYGLDRKRTLDLIEATPTTPIGRIGTAGYYELKGRVECGSPLRAPGTDSPCVYYRLKITREIEERYVDKDGRHKTRTKTETLRSEERSCAFELRDQTGTLAVAPEGAEFESAHEFRDRQRFGSGGGFFEALFGSRSRRTTKGETTQVDSIRVGAQLYALGWVARGRAGFTLQRVPEAAKPFLLSMRSEEELASGLRSSVQLGLGGSAAALVLGVLAIFLGR